MRAFFSSLLNWQSFVILSFCLFGTPRTKWDRENLVDRLNSALVELKFKIRGPQKPKGNVIVVAIDEVSLQKESVGKWPWKRRYQAALIDEIFKQGAKNIALDIVLEDRYLSETTDDQILRAVLEKYRGKITLAWVAQCIGEICKPKDFPNNSLAPFFANGIFNDVEFEKASSSQGFVNASKSGRGKVERAIYFVQDSKTQFASMPLAAIAQREGKTAQELISQTTSPINFYGPPHSIPTLSALCFLSPEEIEGCPTDSAFLKDKTVILGVTALAVGDQVSTAFSPVVDGVEVQATIAERILEKGVPKESGVDAYLLICFLSFGFLFLITRLETRGLLLVTLGSFATFITFDMVCFYKNIFIASGLFYINFGFLSLSSFVMHFNEEIRQKRFLREAFSKYLSPEVIQTLLDHPDALKLGGEKREVTILFCDVRNFTSISEKLDPQSLNRLITDILTTLTTIVFKHRGTVDKYIGDALMAFFGAPVDQPDHAYQACIAAQEMIREIKNKSSFYEKEFGVEVRVGVGINTGIVHVGNMGSEQRFNYSVIGDSVNVASRVETCTKDFRVSILTTRSTLDAVAKTPGVQVPHRSVGNSLLKGKSTAMELFQIDEV